LQEIDIQNGNEREEHESYENGNTLSPLTLDDTDGIVRSFKNLLCFHVLMCETPFAILECLVKFPILLFVGVLLFLSAIVTQLPLLKELAKSWLTEALLVFSSMLTLILLPGSGLYVYRDFDPDEEWEMRPLPTLVGWVDSRRFWAFVTGYGALSSRLELVNTGGTKDSISSTMVLAPSIVFNQGEQLSSWEEEEEEDGETKKALDQLNKNWLGCPISKKKSVDDVRRELREIIDIHDKV